MKGNKWATIADFEFFMEKKNIFVPQLMFVTGTDWWNKQLVPEQIVSVCRVPL
jgi:hypothetical protein